MPTASRLLPLIGAYNFLIPGAYPTSAVPVGSLNPFSDLVVGTEE